MSAPPIMPIPPDERVTVPGWMLNPYAEHYVLRVVGDSMAEDAICDGDFLVVRRCAVAADGEMIVALVGDDATIRRFYHEGETARLEAANRSVDSILVPMADLKIQGVAVGIIRKFDRKEART